MDGLKSYVTSQVVSTVASKLGENGSGVGKAIGALLPTILGGLVNKSSSSGFSGIFDMISDNKNAGFLDDLGGLIGQGNLAKNDPKDIAGNLMGQLFGDKVGGILDMVTNLAGVKKSSTSSILGMVGPLVMGFLSKKIAGDGLNLASFTNLLNSNKRSIAGALPDGMGDFIGFAAPAGGATASNDKKGGMGWLWPLLLAGAAAVAYYFWNQSKTAPVVEEKVEQVVEKKVEKPAAPAIPDGMANFKLPNGTTIQGLASGFESKLLAFLNDANATVGKEADKWYDFDRVNFATGKADLNMEDSKSQLGNLAAIAKAYGDAKFKIGGYTDNTGNADVNLRLSDARANAVMTALAGMGIDATRMEAEGYGVQHPIGDNATEEGRAMNRRTSVRVTAK